MQSEPDHAADAGVGAQALLGLSKIRQENHRGDEQTNANLSGAHNLHTLSRHPTPLTRLAPPPPLNSLPSAPPLHFSLHAHRDTATKKEPHMENKSNPNGLDHTAPKLPIPRLPSLSNTEGRTHNVAFPPVASAANASESPANGLPRLASIAEWASARTPPMPAAVPALPGFNTLPAVHGMQPPLPALPGQTPRQEYAAPAWINPAVPTLQPRYAETPVHHNYHLSSPGMYAAPVPAPPLQTNVPPYYYSSSVPAQYPTLPPALPHLRHATPHSATMHLPSLSRPAAYLPSITPPGLPPPSMSHLAVPSSHLNATALPPIVNGLGKPISSDERILPPVGDTLAQRACFSQVVSNPQVLPTAPAPLNATKNIPIRKSAFAPPTSSGRRLINLMNPTDTLATVASSSPPLPLQKAPVVPLAKPTANMKMARELFGSSSNDLLRKTTKKSTAIHCPEDEYKSASVHPLPNGNSRDARTDLLPAVSEITKLNSNARLTNANSFEQKNTESSQIAVKKEMNFSRKKSDSNATARQDNGKSSRRSSLGDRNSSDSSGEVTRCPCGSKADCGVMICCDQCNTWQHRICMGFRRKSDVPHNYYCNICRPEEMRPGCVAHPEYFQLLEMEGKDAHCDPILHSVKPLELRKLFSADLKAKREGTEEFRRSQVFKRYAKMYRAQFGKDRASVIEGLVVLTELRRSEVEEKLEHAIKKTKKDGESLDVSNGLRRKTSNPNSVPASNIQGIPPAPRPSAKRGRPPGSVSENNADKLGTPKSLQTGGSPDKDFGSGDRNRLSREERKMQQVVSLFARLEEREREKKRPRLGEPSGSPRSASFASPRPIAASASRSGISPTGNLNLAPAIPGVDLNPEQRNVSDEITRSNVRSPVPKRERSTKERREYRRKEPRENREDRGEGNRRNVLLSGRRERRVLSSAAYRKRGKSYSRGVTKVDPRFQVKVHIPGPSVVGSKLVPTHRLSRLDKAAREEENKKTNLASRVKSRKERLLLNSESEEKSYPPKVPPRHHPLRKRIVQYDERLPEVLDKNVNVKKKPNCTERMDTSDLDAEYILPESEKKADAKLQANLRTEFAFNKRFLNRLEAGTENSTRPRTGKLKRSHVEKSAFKKRIMRGEPPRSSLLIRVVPEVKTKDVAKKERKFRPDSDVKMEMKAESKLQSAERPPEKGTDLPKMAKSSKAPIIPRLRSSPLLRPSTENASRSPPPPLRSAAIRSVPNSSKSLVDIVPLPLRSLTASPVPGNQRTPKTPPSFRSVAVKGDLRKAGSSSIFKIPSKNVSTSPPVKLTQTPPFTQRAGVTPSSTRIQPLRSRPVGQFDVRSNSNGNLAQVNGNGTDMNMNVEVSGAGTSSSDILAARLEGFYSQSKATDGPVMAASPKAAGKPQPILGQGHARYTRIPNTSNLSNVSHPSPWMASQGHKNHYRGGPGPWRSFDGVKPLSTSNGPVGKGKNDNRMRNGNTANGNGNRNGSAGAADTTPWGRYRKQNGWDAGPKVAGGKHVGYREQNGPSPSSAPPDGKGGSGRRRPYG